jgi:uncharacterized protein (DUF362 family)
VRHGDRALPILKDHSGAGVTFAMKNMYGVVERPQDLHAGRLQSRRGRSELHPGDSRQSRFTIGDAMSFGL